MSNKMNHEQCIPGPYVCKQSLPNIDIAEIIRNTHQTIENASHIKCSLALINMSFKTDIEIYH